MRSIVDDDVERCITELGVDEVGELAMVRLVDPVVRPHGLAEILLVDEVRERFEWFGLEVDGDQLARLRDQRDERGAPPSAIPSSTIRAPFHGPSQWRR